MVSEHCGLSIGCWGIMLGHIVSQSSPANVNMGMNMTALQSKDTTVHFGIKPQILFLIGKSSNCC